jgi:hypothetical protein
LAARDPLKFDTSHRRAPTLTQINNADGTCARRAAQQHVARPVSCPARSRPAVLARFLGRAIGRLIWVNASTEIVPHNEVASSFGVEPGLSCGAREWRLC